MHDISVPVDAGRLSVWQRPAYPGRPTVMLLHGLTGTSRWWQPVISLLPEEVGVIAPDLRGRGQSWETSGPFDLSSLAVDISVCLNHFEVQKATIAGYSMGAWLAALYGSTRAHRVNGVVLLDGGLELDVDDTDDIDHALETMLGPSFERFGMSFASIDQYLGFWKAHPALSGQWGNHLDSVFSYDLEDVMGKLEARFNTQAIREGAESFLFDQQVVKAVYELTAPTRVLLAERGMFDQPGGFIPESSARDAASRNPSLQVERIAGVNHYTLLLGRGAAAAASAIIGLP